MPAADSHSLIGQTLAERYHVTAKLGEGGMGSAYKATDLKLHSGEYDERVDQYALAVFVNNNDGNPNIRSN